MCAVRAVAGDEGARAAQSSALACPSFQAEASTRVGKVSGEMASDEARTGGWLAPRVTAALTSDGRLSGFRSLLHYARICELDDATDSAPGTAISSDRSMSYMH